MTRNSAHSKALEALWQDIAEHVRLLHLTHEAIICVDQERAIVVFSDGAERIFGYDQTEVMGKDLNMLIPERFRRHHDLLIADFADTAAQAHLMRGRGPIVGLRKDGTEFAAAASVSKFPFGGEFTFTVVLRDTTEWS